MSGGAWHWLSTTAMTVGVRVDASGRIVQTPPIVRRFMGQHLDSLRRWMRNQRGFREAAL